MTLTDLYVLERQGATKAYEFFRPRGTTQPWVKVVWKPCLLPKHRLTFWLLVHGRLRTNDQIPYESCKTCALCQHADESSDHFFFHCLVSIELWNKVWRWLGIRHNHSSFNRLLHTILRSYHGNGRLVKACFLAITCMIYLLW